MHNLSIIHYKNFEEYLYDENNSIARYITPDSASQSPPSERPKEAAAEWSLSTIEAAPRSLNIGDSLVVKILGTKYSNDNKNYSCFGKIIF